MFHVIMRSRPDAALTVELFTPPDDDPLVRVGGLDGTDYLSVAAARELAGALLAVADEHDSRR